MLPVRQLQRVTDRSDVCNISAMLKKRRQQESIYTLHSLKI